MAKAPVKKERAAVTARGVDLLKLIASAPEGFLMLTQDEGAAIVSDGLAVVDASNIVGDTAAVSLTDKGKAMLEDTSTVTVETVASSGFEIDTDVAVPTDVTRKAREDGYPFAKLEIGQSFHVPLKTGEDHDKLWGRISSSASGARSKFAVPTGEKEEVTVKTFKKDENGKFVKDENGKRIPVSENVEVRDKKSLVRDFKVAKVDSTDKRGAGVRVFRTM